MIFISLMIVKEKFSSGKFTGQANFDNPPNIPTWQAAVGNPV